MHPTRSSQRTTTFNQVCDKNNVTLKLFISPRAVNIFVLFFSFFFESTRVLPLLLCIPRCMRKSDLRSSLSQMFCVLNRFFFILVLFIGWISFVSAYFWICWISLSAWGESKTQLRVLWTKKKNALGELPGKSET